MVDHVRNGSSGAPFNFKLKAGFFLHGFSFCPLCYTFFSQPPLLGGANLRTSSNVITVLRRLRIRNDRNGISRPRVLLGCEILDCQPHLPHSLVPEPLRFPCESLDFSHAKALHDHGERRTACESVAAAV